MIGAWTLDRVGPMVRYAEDAALVMQAIAKPDGRDMSVSDIPFNWDARFDVKKLRVGYIKESFDGLVNAPARENASKLLETLRTLGVKDVIPMTIPAMKWPMEATNIEDVPYFDEMHRAGKLAGSRANLERRPARLMPAVEYLQQQRLRMMMMTELAAATKDVDVYMVAAQPTLRGLSPERRAAIAAGIPAAPPTPPAAPAEVLSYEARLARLGPAARHETMANDAGYPAMNVPTGFTLATTPTHVVFFARPFGEEPLIALAKAYQDLAKHHLAKPTLIDEK
jgi:Asp-tRNA(Asn)/Glu-tRNA(Gln) amidotransferase A subunit family amidase